MIISLASCLHILAAICVGIIPASTVAWGWRRAGRVVVDAIDTQPGAAQESLRTFIIGTVLNETAAILGLILSIILLMRGIPTLPVALAELGIAAALAIPSGVAGVCAAVPHANAIVSAARQPLHATRIFNFMILVVMLMQVSVLLGFMTSFFLQMQIANVATIADGLRICAAGFTFGLGTIGPLIGMSAFAGQACTVIGAYPEGYAQTLSFTFVSQALIETPIFFVLGVSLFMGYYASMAPEIILPILVALTFSTLGAGIASGTVATAACEGIGKHPEKAALFSGPSLVAQTFIDAAVIYGLVVVLALITNF